MMTHDIKDITPCINLENLAVNTLYLATCAGFKHLLFKYIADNGIKIATYDLDNNDGDIAQINNVAFDSVVPIKHLTIEV